jgi:hypothetical protein
MVDGMNPDGVDYRTGLLRDRVGRIEDVLFDLVPMQTEAADAPEVCEPGTARITNGSSWRLDSAISLLNSALADAGTLLDAVAAERTAQDEASGNGQDIFDFVAAVGDWTKGATKPYKDWTQWATVLQFPAAVINSLRNPWVYPMFLGHPSTWFSLSWYQDGADFLRVYTTAQSTNRVVGGLSRFSSFFKVKDVVRTLGYGALSAAEWLGTSYTTLIRAEQSLLSATDMLGRTATVFGKVTGVIGVGVGAFQLVDGVTGMMDGDISSDDAWATADGIVNVVTGIGSFAPPPVGLVFAGVGLAYNAGRWLFGEDENGYTGIDRIVNGWNASVDFVGDVANNVADGVGDIMDGAADVIDDLWPW